jgi:hypothetical protein
MAGWDMGQLLRNLASLKLNAIPARAAMVFLKDYANVPRVGTFK